MQNDMDYEAFSPPPPPETLDEYLNTLGERIKVSTTPLNRTLVAPKGSMPFFSAKDVELDIPTFLWFPYLPEGKLTMLEGDPGLGKSWISAWIAAKLSQEGKRVLMLSGEDGLGDTLCPRLKNLGADMGKVFVSDFLFAFDVAGAKKFALSVKAVEPALVVIDPLVAYLGGEVDMHKANEVRALLNRLIQVGKDTNAAILAVRHLRKTPAGMPGSGKDLYKGIGSIDFTAAARSALLVEEIGSGVRTMKHIKANGTKLGPELEYEIEDGRFDWTGEHAPGKRKGGKPQPCTTRAYTVDAARQFLREFLADGPRWVQDIYAAAESEGISTRAIERGKQGVCSSHKMKDGWAWKLITQRPEIVDAVKRETTATALQDALRVLGR